MSEYWVAAISVPHDSGMILRYTAMLLCGPRVRGPQVKAIYPAWAPMDWVTAMRLGPLARRYESALTRRAQGMKTLHIGISKSAVHAMHLGQDFRPIIAQVHSDLRAAWRVERLRAWVGEMFTLLSAVMHTWPVIHLP